MIQCLLSGTTTIVGYCASKGYYSMSDNLPPDFRDDIREHYPRCASLCDHILPILDPDKGLDLFMDLAADVSWWKAPFMVSKCDEVKRRLNEAAACVECPMGHRDHRCSCKDIASSGDPWGTADMVD